MKNLFTITLLLISGIIYGQQYYPATVKIEDQEKKVYLKLRKPVLENNIITVYESEDNNSKLHYAAGEFDRLA